MPIHPVLKKLASLVFAAVVGSTPLAEAADPPAILESDAPREQKIEAFRHLSIRGEAKDVALIAKYLDDPDFAHMARFALERIPGKEAGTALAEATGRLRGTKLAGVVDSIGHRRDPGAHEVLAPLLENPNPEVVASAAKALGNLGSPEAGNALAAALPTTPDSARKARLAVALLACAAKVPDPDDARNLYLAVKNDHGLPEDFTLAAIRAEINSIGHGATTRVVQLLRDKDGKRLELALELAQKLPGKQLTLALVREIGTLPPERATALAEAVALRGDIAAVEPLLDLTSQSKPPLQLAIIRAVGRLGDAGCVDRLLPLAGSDGEEAASALQAALVALPGDAVDEKIAAFIVPTQPPATQRFAMDTAAKRGATIAAPKVLALLDSPDAEIQTAALAALGSIGSQRELPALLQFAAAQKENSKMKPALAAVVKISRRHGIDQPARDSAILSAMRTATPGFQKELARILAVLRKTESSPPDETGFRAVFDGKRLAGWDGKPGWWSVEDGAIVSRSTPEKPVKRAHYLFWTGGQPSDFDLRFSWRLVGGNSGVQFRSDQLADWDAFGYQADMEAGEQWTGAIFAHKRGGVTLRGESTDITPDGERKVIQFADPAELQKLVRKNEWNTYRIVASDREMFLYINDHLMSHAIDRHAKMARSKGHIALQMHPGPPMTVQFKNIRIREFEAR